MQLKGDEKMTTLVQHSELRYDYPKFRWLDDDTLNIDLGKVAWVSRKRDSVGTVRITYSYTITGADWWWPF